MSDRAYYKLKRELESVIDELGVDEILELVETVRRENIVDKRTNLRVEKEETKKLELAQEEINVVWACLEVGQDGFEKFATEEQKQTFKKLYERVSLLETVCGP